MLVDSGNVPRRLADGLPYKLVVDSRQAQCVQFVSLEKNYSTHLMLSTVNLSNINYTLRCFTRSVLGECASDKPLIVKIDNNSETANL